MLKSELAAYPAGMTKAERTAKLLFGDLREPSDYTHRSWLTLACIHDSLASFAAMAIECGFDTTNQVGSPKRLGKEADGPRP
jgi:hypothetical protein